MSLLPGEQLPDYEARLIREAAARAAPEPFDARTLSAAAWRVARAEAIRHRPPSPVPVSGGKLVRDMSPTEYGAALAAMGVHPRRF